MHVDIGCGNGRFAVDLAAARPSLRVLGIDIRAGVVDRARERLALRGGLPNCAFVTGNASAGLRALLSGVHVHGVSVLHPDPWFKSRAHKRRVVSAQFLGDVAGVLPSGARVWLQTDAAVLFESFLEAAANAGPLYRLLEPPEVEREWAAAGLPCTDRERAVRAHGGAIYRTLLERTAVVAAGAAAATLQARATIMP